MERTDPGTEDQTETADASSIDDAAEDVAANETTSETEISEDGDAAAEPVAIDPADMDVDGLRAELEKLTAQHARAVADYQNLRRRQAEERREHSRLTQKTQVLNYLPMLDDLTRALDTVGDHAELTDHPWLEGVRMVQRKFVAVLEASGVERIETDGDFNPELHQSVSTIAGPSGKVMLVAQDGYTVDGMVIRPAMVLIGNGEDDTASAPAEETNDEAQSRESGEG
ncbi:MAG TPA: nucleotide exchange factor GrpE [Dehalococcoidia bacterium]|nr:nucleotide exchange factor GrpE [Dehalococcoidia bacterium]